MYECMYVCMYYVCIMYVCMYACMFAEGEIQNHNYTITIPEHTYIRMYVHTSLIFNFWWWSTVLPKVLYTALNAYVRTYVR